MPATLFDRAGTNVLNRCNANEEKKIGVQEIAGLEMPLQCPWHQVARHESHKVCEWHHSVQGSDDCHHAYLTCESRLGLISVLESEGVLVLLPLRSRCSQGLDAKSESFVLGQR